MLERTAQSALVVSLPHSLSPFQDHYTDPINLCQHHQATMLVPLQDNQQKHTMLLHFKTISTYT